MFPRRKLYLFVKEFFIFCSFIRLSYQQYSTHDRQSFVVEYNSPTNTLFTIQSFWHESNDDCDIDSSVLIGIFRKLVDISCDDEDQFVVLLRHYLRKQLIKVMSAQLDVAIKEKSFGSNKIFAKNMNELQEIDKNVIKSILAMSINRLDIEDIIEEIVRLQDEELQIDAFQKLITKCLLDITRTSSLMPFLTFHIVKKFKKKISCDSDTFETSLERLYCHLPQELRVLYEDLKQPYILTNHVRLPKGKQTICTLITFHDKGFVAFGIQLGGSVEYIYGDDSKRVYFLKSSNFKSNQLWQVIWPSNSYRQDADGYTIFQNKMTKKLLCLEDLKLVQLGTFENMQNPACYWRISYATKTEIAQEC